MISNISEEKNPMKQMKCSAVLVKYLVFEMKFLKFVGRSFEAFCAFVLSSSKNDDIGERAFLNSH